ncbi:MAG: glycosidase, partial [Bacilli bacterium]|nr:glycosidase [Bacilli bacterium]
TFSPERYIMPSNIYEEYGLEDPRITKIDDYYYITYSVISSCGINVGLLVTTDFKTFSPIGNIFHSDNKDCVIFPQRMNNKYYALHRPSISHFGKLDIWIAESENLQNWGNHKILLDARIKYTESYRIGAGTVPLLTDRGWLEIYHSADKLDRYHLTAMLMDKNNPTKILMKSKRPLIYPTEEYEKKGFVNNVVFTCGMIREEDMLTIYYGVCDQRIACVTLHIDEVWENMEKLSCD